MPADAHACEKKQAGLGILCSALLRRRALSETWHVGRILDVGSLHAYSGHVMRCLES